MSIDYEKICDEWMVYITQLDLESRKIKFKEYLEASGVYDLDASTIFYLSELNNFLTEGITTLLHDKAQEAKKSGKGLAHYRHTSFALSKPDAMNIVHEYIHKKVLLHTEMMNNNIKEMPNTFSWSFLFNIPEYVNNKKLLTPQEIPSLPQAKDTPKSVMTSELEETLNTQIDEEEEYSSDPFDIAIDDRHQQQQIIENLKNKLISKPLKEYSPDPYDVDENIQQYTPEPEALLAMQNNNDDEPITFDGIKHGSTINGHGISATTIISGGGSGSGSSGHTGSATMVKLQQLQGGSNYLDSWSKNKSKLMKKNKDDNDNKTDQDRERETIIIKKKIEINSNNIEHSPETPIHRKVGSTIQGGYWKTQSETSSKLIGLFADAQEHRDEIVHNMQNINDNIEKIVNLKQDKQIFVDIKTFLKQQNSDIITVIKDINDRNNKKNKENNYNEKKREFEEKMDINNTKYEEKIINLENRISELENEIKMKDNLIQTQTLNIKRFEINNENNNNIDEIKSDIMRQIELQFNKFELKNENKKNKFEKESVFNNEQMMDIMDKTDEILTKLKSISKYQQQLKQQYTFINDGIDGINNLNEKYYNQTVRKMNDFQHKMSENINDICLEQKGNNNHNNNNNNNNNLNNGLVVHEMVKVTNLASQLTQDMNAASMLSVMRNEYNNIRKEKEEMRGEVERYRKENEILSFRKQELEEEAINVRESKRRTIKNLVDEINDMRDQIFKLANINGRKELK